MIMGYRYSQERDSRLCWSFIAFLVVLLSCSFPVFSASLVDVKADKTDLTNLSIEELANIEVVVSASKHKQKTSDAPSSVTIITSDDVKKYGYRTLADILKSVRSFYVSYDRNYNYVGVRGFSPPGDYGTRVLVMIDGHRINDAVYQQAMIGTEFPLDVGLIDRIEIIRGPSSSLYGSNALFAVINVITKKGNDIGGTEVSAEAASYDTFKTGLSYGSAPKQGRDILVSGSLYNSGGQELFFDEFNGPDTNYGFTDHDGDEYRNLFATMTIDDFTIQTVFSRREKEIPTAPWDVVFNDPDTVTIDERNYIDFKWERKFLQDWDVLVRIYYDQYFYSGKYAYDYSDEDCPPDIVDNIDHADAEWIGSEIQASRPIGEKHYLTFGAELQDNFSISQRNFDREIYLDDSRNLTNWAAYVQDEFTIKPNLILNAGVRHDQYETFGGTTNPRVALIYNFTPDTTIKLLYGQAFRAPNPYELYYDDDGITQKKNPDLEPETIETYEAVLEKQITPEWRASVSVFQYAIDNLIRAEEDPEDGLIFFKNIDSAKSTGCEFEVGKNWKNGGRLNASYSYQETKDQSTDEVLVNSPKQLAKMNLLIPLVRDRLFTGTEVQYVDDRISLEGSEIDNYTVVNLTLFAGKFSNDWEVSVSVYNLFDVNYADAGSEEHAQNSIEQDGRNFRIKVTHKF